MKRREIDLLIISDIHLGAYGCRSKELLKYLKSVKPKRLVLNGDIIDIWQFKKRFWPDSHMQVLNHIINLISSGVQVDYITGNHDELLRKFAGFQLGSFKIRNKLLLNLNNERTWIFHGDVFDVTMKYSKWLCRLGSVGYDMLIMLNGLVNWIFKKLGKGKISLSKRVKNSVKKAVKFINDFEQTAANIGIENGYTNVVCGHIHQPNDRIVENHKGKIRYLNSGDWIENLTALEYHNCRWTVYEYDKDIEVQEIEYTRVADKHSTANELFGQLLSEFSNIGLEEEKADELETAV